MPVRTRDGSQRSQHLPVEVSAQDAPDVSGRENQPACHQHRTVTDTVGCAPGRCRDDAAMNGPGAISRPGFEDAVLPDVREEKDRAEEHRSEGDAKGRSREIRHAEVAVAEEREVERRRVVGSAAQNEQRQDQR